MTIQMKATEQHFPAVLFIMLYKVVLTCESEDEILKCHHHSNESVFITSRQKLHENFPFQSYQILIIHFSTISFTSSPFVMFICSVIEDHFEICCV